MRKTLLTAATALSLTLAFVAGTSVFAEQAETKSAAKAESKEQTPAKPKLAPKEKSELLKRAEKQKNPAHFDIAFMLQTQNIINMAIPEYRDALKADPKFVSTYNNLAQCLWDRNDGKDREEARGLLNKALELEPKNIGTMHVLALIRETDKDTKGAEELYRKILSNQPLNRQAVQNLSELCFRTGRKDEAKKVISTALANSPPEPDVMFYKQALANLDSEGKSKAGASVAPEKKSGTKTSTKKKKSETQFEG